MARKRKLSSAVAPDAVSDSGTSAAEDRAGGMWAGSMMNMIEHRMSNVQSSLRAGLLAGTVVIELDPLQVIDKVGSDRVSDWVGDDDFEHLMANIKRRGQTQPIRVRPEAPDWEPDAKDPLTTEARFVIQSGRRRLMACRALGIKVKAIISTEQGDAALADLEERFAENTMRRALSGFEELLSIGVLAQAMPDLTQTEIAARLGVPQGDISLGLACLQYRREIEAAVDVATTPKRAFRSLIPEIKRGGAKAAPAADKVQRQLFDVRGIRMSAKPFEHGFAVSIPKARIREEHLDQMLIDLAKVVMKYQSK